MGRPHARSGIVSNGWSATSLPGKWAGPAGWRAGAATRYRIRSRLPQGRAFPRWSRFAASTAFLAGQGIPARQISRETPLWLGHWVRIDGLASVDRAEEARRRLLAGGLTEARDAETAGHAISLGVFRDRERAQRVTRRCPRRGFSPELGDRYRPTAEEWLLVTTSRAASFLDDFRLPGGRILRAEPAACSNTGSPAPKVRDVE